MQAVLEIVQSVERQLLPLVLVSETATVMVALGVTVTLDPPSRVTELMVRAACADVVTISSENAAQQMNERMVAVARPITVQPQEPAMTPVDWSDSDQSGVTNFSAWQKGGLQAAQQ